MFKRLTVLALASISACLFANSQIPPLVESGQAYPEYRCSSDWQPFDLAFSSDGMLYSMDGFRNVIFQHRSDCRQLAVTEVLDSFGGGIRGLATDEHGRICFTFVRPSSLLINRQEFRPSLFCVAESSATDEPEFESPGLLPAVETRGMASVDEHYLIALWHGGYAGTVAVVRDGEVLRLTQLGPWLLPHFIYPISVDEYFVTVLNLTPTNFDWLERVPAADGGSVLHVRQDTVTELVSGLTYPTGIVGSEDRLFVADYLDGVIRVFSLEGEFLGEVPGFEGPMGLARAPGGDICVAEMDAGRVTCLPNGALLTSQ